VDSTNRARGVLGPRLAARLLPRLPGLRVPGGFRRTLGLPGHHLVSSAGCTSPSIPPWPRRTLASAIPCTGW